MSQMQQGALDLQRLGLESGEARHLRPMVALAPVSFAGESYRFERPAVQTDLEISRIGGPGYALRLQFSAVLIGPCMRCLKDAASTVQVDAREVSVSGADEELSSPYIDGEQLDLEAWVRDSAVLALPAKILCSEQCRGLCPECAVDLNLAPADHHHDAQPDARWQKLRELSG